MRVPRTKVSGLCSVFNPVQETVQALEFIVLRLQLMVKRNPPAPLYQCTGVGCGVALQTCALAIVLCRRIVTYVMKVDFLTMLFALAETMNNSEGYKISYYSRLSVRIAPCSLLRPSLFA